MTVPAEIELQATTDESLYNTGYSVVIINEDAAPGTHMAACGSGTTCGASDWVTWAENPNPQPRHFRAELRHAGAVVASDQVVVDVVAAEWTVSLEANATSVTVPAEIELEATANRSMSGTGYSIKIVDVDDARDMNGWCSGATCGASEWMTWADNPSPEPQTYRAEVRHSATGTAVASDTVTVDVLPFTFGASLGFSVENGVNKATATATPSPNGTLYSIQIRRLDGTQVCNVWIDSYSKCKASVSVGSTYRATVQNNSGHVAGQSPWWTLTTTGPLEEKADDLDLIALAALYASPSAICSHVLLYPGTHVAGSSVSDQYLACEAAVVEGKTTLGVLRAIAAAGGGTAVLWYLHEQVTEETVPHDPSDDDEIPDPTPIPPPIAWPNTLSDDVDQLMTQNPQPMSVAVATTVLKTCQRAVLRAGLETDDCLDLPIFASGDLDVPQPTQHDRDSLSIRPQWVLLNYESGAGKPGAGWYSGSAQCPNPRPTGQDCHEYPFFSTKQGGPNVLPLPRVKLVASGQNRAQGSLYSHFARECLGRVDNAPFLSIPMPKGSGIPTLRLCN